MRRSSPRTPGPTEAVRRLATTGIGAAVLVVGVTAAALFHPGDRSEAVATTADTETVAPDAAEAPSVEVGGADLLAEAPSVEVGGADLLAEAEPVGDAVTLAFGGDVHFEGMIRPQLQRDPVGLLEGIAPVLESADVAVVNLETAITEGGTPDPKQYTFRAPPSALDALQAAGVDVVTLANNHGMDFGVSGLRDSLDAAAERGLPLIGAGTDETAAYAPHVADVDGQRIAIIGATQVLDDYAIATWTAGPTQPGLASAKRVDRLVEEVRRARDDADTVVVYVHWGVERETCPSTAQQELAQALVDAGADVVVGAHTHRLQGAGRLDDALVAYGLGNFVFYSSSGPGTHSGVLLVTVRGRDVLSYEWVPAVLVNGLPVALPGAAYHEARGDWADLRGCTGLDA